MNKIFKSIKGLFIRPKKIILHNTFKNWFISQAFGWTEFAKKMRVRFLKTGKQLYRYGVHTGIDYAPGHGVPIPAPHDGICVVSELTDKENKGRGIHLAIWDKKQNIGTRYYHLSGLTVMKGDSVRAGQIIGYIGNTGKSEGAHLHFELVRTDNRGRAINTDNGAGGAIDPKGPAVEWII